MTLPPFGQSWAAGVALVPLLILARDNSPVSNFLSGLFTGLIYYGAGLYWILYYNPWIYFLVLLCHLPFLGLFLAGTGVLLGRFKENIWIHFLGPPIVWVALSFFYEQMPIGGVGTQALFYQPLVWMQSCRFFGIFGIVFLWVLLNSAITILFRHSSKTKWVPFIIMVGLFIGNFVWGKKALAQTFAGQKEVALIQHNLPVGKEWWLRNHRFILDTYRSLAMKAAEQKPSLIVFPSYALPFDAFRNPDFLQQLAKETQTYLLVATYIPTIPNRRIAEVGQYEVALLFSPEGELVGADKAVRAPPFRDIRQELAKETKLLESPLGRMGILLCFEDILPSVAKREVGKGAEILAAISNPGHFLKTFVPGYHLYQDQLRAIENHRFVIRVSANGYSAVINPRGRIVKQTQLGKQQILYAKV